MIFLPVLVLIRILLTKPIRQFVSWDFVQKVGHFPDGLWLEIHNAAGELHGHFTSKNERQMQLAFERIQLWDDNIEVMDKRHKVMSLYQQRGILLLIAVCSIGLSWIYREEQRVLLNGLNRQVQQVTHPTQAITGMGHANIRTEVAKVLQVSKPKWDPQLSTQQNEQVLVSDVRQSIQQIPSHPMAKSIFVEQYLDLFPFSRVSQSSQLWQWDRTNTLRWQIGWINCCPILSLAMV